MAKLFGTDGVRGVANAELSPELAFHLGRAGAAVLALRKGERARVVVGRDTRRSGDLLEAALAAGIASVGADVLLVGVIPTPGVAFLTRALQADAGAVISASHNPVEDNGIKFFSGDGFKLPDSVEEEIETHLLDSDGALRLTADDGLARPVGGEVGRIRYLEDGVGRYCRFLQETAGVTLAGWRVAVDCGNGAASAVAPRVLAALGADVVALHAEPDGVNINVGCGSTAPAVIQRAVRESGARVGFSHDGDADRVIAVDERGNLVDGDGILAVLGLYLLRRGRLAHRTIAATVYSNMGLRLALEREGGRVLTTQAGDRYVLEAMRRHGLVLGGEQSGHIVLLEHNTTGDGVLTALQLLRVMVEEGRPLSELAAVMQPAPQVLVNVPVRSKDGLAANAAIAEAVRAAEVLLGDAGRILVRPSGTEPVIRVMGEGLEAERVRSAVEEVVSVIQRELG